MGTAASTDEEIFGKRIRTATKLSSSQLSEDGRDLLIGLIYGSGSTRAELYYKDLERNGPVAPIVNDLDSLFFGEIRGRHALRYRRTGKRRTGIFIAWILKHRRGTRGKKLFPRADATIESSGPYRRQNRRAIFAQRDYRR